MRLQQVVQGYKEVIVYRETLHRTDTRNIGVDLKSKRKMSGNYNQHGDIMQLHPTGAGHTTSQQDGPRAPGVGASQSLVDTDYGRLNKYRHSFNKVAARTGIHPAVIGAIASRETRGGNHPPLQEYQGKKGYGDFRHDGPHGYGLMQVDRYTSGLGTDPTQCAWDGQQHMDMAMGVFLNKLQTVKQRFPGWSKEQQLQGAIAAYNGGENSFNSWEGVDSGTTGGDYSNDVLARAQHLVNKHGW